MGIGQVGLMSLTNAPPKVDILPCGPLQIPIFAPANAASPPPEAGRRSFFFKKNALMRFPSLAFGLFALPLLFLACRAENKASYLSIEGQTMGTTYHITYADSLGNNYQFEVDSVLREVNMALSTYIPESLISRYNRNDSTLRIHPQDVLSRHFINVHHAAERVYYRTGGAFNPQVMGLVNYWGFGYTPKRAVTQVDSLKVDSLMADMVADFTLMLDVEGHVLKPKRGMQLDFSAIAKGYGVDAVALLLEAKGVRHYLVEIGGELRSRGLNAKGQPWVVGISTPKDGAAVDEFQAYLKISGRSMATSGNYRNFHEVDGRKYAHTINPKTGYPELNSLLSATIVAEDCMSADAYATACMVMGVDSAMLLLEAVPGLDGYLIYSDAQGQMQVRQTAGMAAYLLPAE